MSLLTDYLISIGLNNTLHAVSAEFLQYLQTFNANSSQMRDL